MYRSQYGLSACTTANGCFKRSIKPAKQAATRRLIRTHPTTTGWKRSHSISTWCRAVCPNCHIILVETNSASNADLFAGVDEAASLGVNVLSLSWGGPEDSGWAAESQSDFDRPGIAIVASTGDEGYGVEEPASSQYVTAVGGTTLTRDSSTSRGWTETAWAGTGSGCSAYIPKPAWQTDSGCANRSLADVSANADPQTGVAVYNTYTDGGWITEGGTSEAAPIIAGVYALGGHTSSFTPGSSPYAHPGAFNDIKSGNNGTCAPSYLCTAGPGWDGPTGLGTPKGTGGFGGPDPTENLSACDDNILPADDDGSTGAVDLPFTADFFGSSYNQLYVNNNGNVTFNSPLSTYTPFGLTSTDIPIIAPFFADVDTRGPGSGLVTYGGEAAGPNNPNAYFCVDWYDVGYYGEHTDKLNSFQLVLTDRSQSTGQAGDFDIQFDYDGIQWETGDASGGSDGLGGTSAVVGYSNGTSESLELNGSAINGALLDGGPDSLIDNSENSTQPGQYIFPGAKRRYNYRRHG